MVKNEAMNAYKTDCAGQCQVLRMAAIGPLCDIQYVPASSTQKLRKRRGVQSSTASKIAIIQVPLYIFDGVITPEKNVRDSRRKPFGFSVTLVSSMESHLAVAPLRVSNRG